MAGRAISAEKESDTPPGARDGLSALLRDRGLVSPDALARAALAMDETGERTEVVVTRLGLLSEDALAAALCAATGLEQAHAADFPAEAVARDRLSPAFLRDNRIVPLCIADGRLVLAMVNPLDTDARAAVAFAMGVPVDVRIARSSDIDAALDRLYRADAHDGDDTPDTAYDEEDVERLRDLVSDAPVIRAVNRLIAQASDAGASDIHLEPTDDALSVRLRIDGMLRAMPPLPAAMRAPMVSRIKIMSGLNIAEKRLPQDGRLRIAVRGHDIDLRVATAPSIHGESVVMRILDRSKLPLDFPSLGFAPDLIDALRAAIHRPFGIVLVTGPTGSGKTTTLYAALSELNRADRKLLTVEDPIEYRLPGVVQTQVNPAIDFTFGAALRSFLRQDPDVMMVGEIRDTETAQIAVQAALTGHMLLSTLHTNSASGAVTRLLDMDVEPFLLSSVLSGVLAQRLVRRLCVECREPYDAPSELLHDLGLAGKGKGKNKDKDKARDRDAPGRFFHARGCDACGGQGYAGRVGLFEFLSVDDAIARLILRRADTREIAAAAMAAGMRTLWQDGLAKAAAGLTTLEEAARVAVEE